MKRSECEANHRPASVTEPKNEWSYTCTPPYAFLSCLGINLSLFFTYAWFLLGKAECLMEFTKMRSSEILLSVYWQFVTDVSSVQPIGTTYRYNLSVQPIGTTYRHNLSAQPIGTTYRYNLSVQPIGTTYRYNLSAQPIGTTYRFHFQG
jgi:hypothetical protein